MPFQYSGSSNNGGRNNKIYPDILFDDTKENLRDYNVVNRYEFGNDWFHTFSRVPYIDPFNTNKRTKEYLFFTKPDLNITSTAGVINDELARASSFFRDAVDRYPYVVEQLQSSKSINTGGGYLAPLLSNAVNSSLELPSINADYIETAKNVYQTSISYRGTSFKSDQDYEFSLEFKDTKFLDVYMYFKMYDEYERLKWTGQVSPPSLEYIKYKILHDQFSIYKIITDEDGSTILYWARVMGVYPTSVPRDAISNIEGELTYSVSFKAQFVYDMDPRILSDFNRLVAGIKNNKPLLPLYNKNTKQFDGSWASCPFIHTRSPISNNKDKRNKYYLLWAK